MKKMLKLFAAFAMISLVISFAGCDMATEDELLETVAENPADNNTPGNAGSNGTGSSGTGSNNNGGGTGTGGSGSNTGNSGSSSTSPIWSKFEGADMQVWEETASLTPTAEGLDIKVKNTTWWGMCFCNKADVGPEKEHVTFDMSKVKTITVEAKASTPLTIWLSQSDSAAAKVYDEEFDIDTSYKTLTYTLTNPGTQDYGVLDIGGNNNPYKAVISIKNIKFLDASGKEIVPTRSN